MSASQLSGDLSDVPEEILTPIPSNGPLPNSPYVHTHHQGAASTSTFYAPSPTLGGLMATAPTNGTNSQSITLRKSSSMRGSNDRLGRETTGSSGSLKKQALAGSSSSNSLTATREGKISKHASSDAAMKQRVRVVPRLPHAKDVELAPTTFMYWSKAPVYGQLPMRGMRAHSVTLVDNIAWLFGGCDDNGCWKDVYCFDTETMQWSHPKMMGEIPLPCRAHSATLVDRKIVFFGGGAGPVYYDTVYVLDTITRRWKQPKIEGIVPAPRRAHSAVLYRGKIWIFGGGNGMQALNDVWTLDVGSGIDKMRWEKIETKGRKPAERGYHSANLIGNVMVVIGGSDGRECFADIWCLNLDTAQWSKVALDVEHRRLAHSSTQVGSYLFLVGGHNGTKYTSDLLLYNLVSLQYEPRFACGKSPSSRGYHAAIVTDSRLFLLGGFNGHDVHNDVHILDLAGAAYLPQVMSFTIEV